MDHMTKRSSDRGLGKRWRSLFLFVVVMVFFSLLELPCDFKGHMYDGDDKRQKHQNLGDRHLTSLLPPKASGEITSKSCPPWYLLHSGVNLQNQWGHRAALRFGSAPLPPKRHLQHTTKTAYLQRKLPVPRLYALPGVLLFLQTCSALNVNLHKTVPGSLAGVFAKFWNDIFKNRFKIYCRYGKH